MKISLLSIYLSEFYNKYLEHHKFKELLNLIELEIEEINILEEELELISIYLHLIYVEGDYIIRSIILRICLILELKFKNSIFKKYNFTELVSLSIERLTQENLNKIDEEKLASFKIISILIEIRNYLPKNIIRSLIFLYYNKNLYKSLILSYFYKSIILCKNIFKISEIFKIIIENFLENNNKEICNLISYSIENFKGFINNEYYLSKLISPLSYSNNFNRNIIDNCSRSLILLLRTWPGLIEFGILNNGIINLINCLNYETGSIIRIFNDLLRLGGPKNSILNNYCGFLLNYLKENKFIYYIEKLLEDKLSIENFYKNLLPYINNFNINNNNINNNNNNNINNNNKILLKSNLNEPISIIYKINRSLICSRIPIKIQEIELNGSGLTWDWYIIYNFINIILKHNEIESQNLLCKNFYNNLLDFFSNGFLSSEPPQTQIMTETLFSLFELLIFNKWGYLIIENHQMLRSTMLLSIHSLRKNEIINKEMPVWSHFRCICKMMNKINSINILNKWGFKNILEDLGQIINNINTAKLVLNELEFYPESSFISPIYLKFLLSPNLEIFKLSINILKEKLNYTPNFHISGLQEILLPFIKYCYQHQEIERLPLILNFLFKLILLNEKYLNISSNDKELHKILFLINPIGYSYLFSNSQSILLCNNLEEIILWWLEKGNKKYIKSFDLAISSSFEGEFKDLLNKEPSIIIFNGFCKIPPHLFGELSKSYQGVNYLVPYIKFLINKCESNNIKEIRSAFFALSHFSSNINSIEYVKEFKIPEILLKISLLSNSLILKSTLINCFSLFYKSKEFENFLVLNNWHIYQFGNYECVLPLNYKEFFERKNLKIKKLKNFKIINFNKLKYKEFYENLIGFLNPIFNEKCKEFIKLNEYLFEESEICLYCHKILGNYNFNNEIKKYFHNLLKNKSLKKINKEIEINEEILNECQAKLYYILQNNKFNENLINLKLPKFNIKYLINNNYPIEFIEYFINEEEFIKLTNYNLNDFLKLNKNDKNNIKISIYK